MRSQDSRLVGGGLAVGEPGQEGLEAIPLSASSIHASLVRNARLPSVSAQ